MTEPAPTPTPSTTLGSDSKVQHLVLDTGALIKGQGYSLARMAEHFWTIPEVIAEVRDPRARFHLDTLPFELRTREPTLEACKAVAEFARQTGDYSALSKVDLRVLALTYTLEAEEHGGKVGHLRTTTTTRMAAMVNAKASAVAKVGGEKKVGEEEEEEKKEGEGEAGDERMYVEVAGGDSSDEEEEDEDEEEEEEEEEEDESESGSEEEEEEEVGDEAAATTATAAAPTPTPTPPPPPASSSSSSSTVKAGFSWASAVKATASKPPPPANAVAARRQRQAEAEGTPAIPLELENLSLNEKEDHFGATGSAANTTATKKSGGEVTSRFLGGAGRDAATHGGGQEEEDDGEGWISVENIKAVRAKGTESLFGARKGDGYTGVSLGEGGREGGGVPPAPVVACVTTDFGMQNVLLQMGLRLLSIDGVAVTRVKQWARRCESCAKIVHDQERMFCPRCGNAYLSRVSISVDSVTGQLRVHLSKLWRPRKGCKYSIPKAPKGKTGRWEGDLLLREDQLQMGIWQQKVKRRTKALNSMFGADITETLGVAVTKTAAADGIQFGYGRKNPNSQRGRERRGKKKRNKN
jgi:RNA-binding protein NOB1